MAKKLKDSPTFEESIEKLSNMAEMIKAPDMPLSDAIKCYEDGKKYFDICMDILENAKQHIVTVEEVE